jgi:copper(I)-binding protein
MIFDLSPRVTITEQSIMTRLLMTAAAALTTLTLASAAAAAPPAIAVSNAWFRALPAGLPAGGYFTLTNKGSSSMSLVGASSSACGMLMLHQSETSNGVSRMTDVAKVDVAAGDTMRFAPGGYHLMCMRPAATLKQGSDVPVTFLFSDGSKATVPFAVRSATGQ